MSKRKTNDLHDIIDTAFVAADYSHGNGYYDEINDYKSKNTHTNANTRPYTGSFSKISTNPLANENNSNIFLKYSSDKNTGLKQDSIKNIESIENSKREIKITEDEFPSLGCGNQSKKTNTNTSTNTNTNTSTNPPMNFKKIVETKKPVEIQQQQQQQHQQQQQQKHDDYFNRFKIYEEVKYYSEKNARNKIYNEIDSDNDYDQDDYADNDE